MKLSVIIPVLNEAAVITCCLEPLQHLRERGHEIILADGGSEDATVEYASALVDRIVESERGRAVQMNSGAGQSTGELLLFLHADTRLPENVDQLLLEAVQSAKTWGRFDVRLSGKQALLRVIEWFINLRSRLTGIATGDQAMFVTRELFDRINGFPQIALMEDVAISKELRRWGKPVCLRQRVITSSRRWEQNGIIRTIFKMWGLRLRYALGADPDKLAGEYE